MNIAIILLALQAAPATPVPASQVTQLSVRDRGTEVSVSFSAPKQTPTALVEVFSRHLVHKGQYNAVTDVHSRGLGDYWVRDPRGFAQDEKTTWKAEVTLLTSGTHDIAIGRERVRVRISRSEFKTWRRDLDALQEWCVRVQAIAEKMDEAGTQAKLIKKLGEDVARERARLASLKGIFTASPQAVHSALDGLWFQTLLLDHRNSSVVEPAREDAPPAVEGASSAVGVSMRGLKEFIDREATVHLLDELLLGLGDKAEGEQIVLRWKSREAVLLAVAEASKGTAPGLALEPFLKAATEKTEEDPAIVQKLVALRKSLVLAPTAGRGRQQPENGKP